MSFGNQVINTASASQSTTVTATSLTAPITVTAPTGFQVSNANVNGGAFAQSISLQQDGNGAVNTTVNVRFLPTTAGNFVGNVTFTSTTATANVGVSGTGTLPPPILTATPSPLADFGQVRVGSSSNTPFPFFNVSGQDLQGPVTITPPTGFRIRTGNNAFSTTAIVLTPTNGTLASTQIDVRFSPTAIQTYASDITVVSTNATTQLVRVTGEGIASTGNATLVVDPTTIDFGTITSSGSTRVERFEVSGTDLTDNITLTASSTNIQFRNATAGGSFSNAPIVLTRTGGTVTPQSIEVQLVPLVAKDGFNESISVVSGLVSSSVTVTANNPSGGTSDISVANPDGNTFTFATRPNTTSVSQRYLLSGTNLVQDLVVRPIGPNAQYFQVSADNVVFSNSLSFTPDAQNNVVQRPIFVRFIPGSAAITVTATIRNSSAPAPNADVSVTGISQPTIRLNNALGDFGQSVVKLTTSAPKTVRLEGFLLDGNVGIRFPADGNAAGTLNTAATPLFEFSLNSAAYTKEATITPNVEGNFVANLDVRFAPPRVGNADQNLEFSNFSFFGDNNFNALSSGFGRATGFSIAVEPTAQSTARVVRNGTSATITFDLSNPPTGTTYGQSRLVIGSSTYLTTLPTNLFPRDKQNFDPGAAINGAYQYGSGTAIEAGTNTFVVFSGNTNSFTVSNLTSGVSYKFYGFEFNNDGVLNAENYRVPNNEPQVPLPVELVSFSAKLRNNAVVLNWATASEKNNRGFEIQRSQTGKESDFTTILTKEGAGSTTTQTKYEAVDSRPLPGLSFYRLKQTDFDGATTITKAIAIRATLGEVSLYPNPTQGEVTILVPQGSTENLAVRITDLVGREVQAGVLKADGKLDTSNLKAGTYIVVIGEGKQAVSRKLVKN
ncbi:Por secretion system C-terminal sorting domain-containing protein [Hymenobacter daecheongensis DSM 21074]|uniref:Por secretion system C-terminal sorting domain-containing protein n=1 Tax=Hymenobacter daecheongensis DSM 21074 TaxID=1121955 RepID=A0A1M6F1H9_9BACT|nr:T9SS type A sorting domain-containing protein [Hymenobacter daecheongensis]SHI91537.1 Por secretion system C-terminal sorting domain-containing protein [Hymenobacter daecheongensis DSM 21074]